MRRWLAFITLMLLLGAVTTVLVAWVSAATEEVWYRGEPVDWWSSDDESYHSFTTTGWERSTSACLTATWVQLVPVHEFYIFERFRSAPVRPTELPSWDASRLRCDNDRNIWHAAHGWPMRAMIATEFHELHSTSASSPRPRSLLNSYDEGLPILAVAYGLFEPSRGYGNRTDAGGDKTIVSLGPLAISKGSGRVRAIPLHPLAGGFLLNTLFFAALWSALLLIVPAARALRRHLRRRRQRCPWCAHLCALGELERCTECGKLPTAQISTPGTVAFAVGIAATLLIASGAASLATMRHNELRLYDDSVEMAVWRGDLAGVIALIDAAETSSQRDGTATPDGTACQAFLEAARFGRLEIVQALLERGIDPMCGYEGNYPDRWAYNSLEHAISGGHREVIELLIDRIEENATRSQARPQRPLGSEHLMSALGVFSGGKDGVQVSPEAPHRIASDLLLEALRLALLQGDVATTRSIVERAPRWRVGYSAASAEHWTVLFTSAAQGGSLEALRLMLEKRGRSVDSACESGVTRSRAEELRGALGVAARARRLQMVELLLAEGALVQATETGADSDAGSVLMAAILGGDVEIVRRILDAGAAPDAIPDSGELPSLTIAMAFRFHDIARLLVERGADPNRAHEEFGTPLHAAKQMGLPESSLRLLEELGAVVEADGIPLDYGR